MLKSCVKEKAVPKNFKATPSEHQQIRELAKKYANGNVSLWVRYAALNYKPTKVELSND